MMHGREKKKTKIFKNILSCIHFFNYNAKSNHYNDADLSQIAPKRCIFSQHCGKFVKISFHKGAGTKMHKCLVGSIKSTIEISQELFLTIALFSDC